MPDLAPPQPDTVCPREWTSGVDWFRWRCDDGDASDDLQRVAEAIQAEDREGGSKLRPWHFQKAEGKRTHRIRWARQRNLIYVETSGAWADTTWRLLPLSTGRLTRIDLQSTWTLSEPARDFGTRCLPPSVTDQNSRLPNGMPVGRHTLKDGGWLGTVADRTAPEHFRVYDKGVESRQRAAGHQWRLELEVKYRHAAQMGVECLEVLKEPTWCARYAISRWRLLGLPLPITVDGPSLAAVRPPKRPPSAVAKQRAWVSHTVVPVVRQLLATHTIAELLELLDLGVLAVPRSELDGSRELLSRCASERLRLAGELSLLADSTMGGDPPRAHS